MLVRFWGRRFGHIGNKICVKLLMQTISRRRVGPFRAADRKQSCTYTSQPAGFSTPENQHRLLLRGGSSSCRNTHLQPHLHLPAQSTTTVSGGFRHKTQTHKKAYLYFINPGRCQTWKPCKMKQPCLLDLCDV